MKGGSEYWLAKVSEGVVLGPPSQAKSTMYQIVKKTAAICFGLAFAFDFWGQCQY